jgi:hypothetical protein
MWRMCDSASVPSDGVLAAAHKGGVGVWAGYLASPYAAHGWTADDLTRVLAHIGHLLPVYVAPFPKGKSRPTRADFIAALQHADPVAEAKHAIAELHTIRGRAGGVVSLALDIEAGVWAADPAGVLRYFASFVHEVGALDRDVQVMPYSSPSCLIGLGQHDRIPHVWAASWLSSTKWPTVIAPPGLGSAWAGNRAWQYHGDTRAFGFNVDLSVVGGTIPLMRHYTKPAAPAAPAPAPATHTAPVLASVTVVAAGKTYRGNVPAV